MNCFICQDSATLACPRCGRSVCNRHQARQAKYDARKYICESCFQEVEGEIAAQQLREKQWQEQETRRKAEEARKQQEEERERQEWLRKYEEQRPERAAAAARERQAEFERSKCQNCGGSGWILFFKCPSCKGDGKDHGNYSNDKAPWE